MSDEMYPLRCRPRPPLYVDSEGLADIQARLAAILEPYRAEQKGRTRVTPTTAVIPVPPEHSP